MSIDTLEYSTVTFTGQGSTDLDLGTIFYSWQVSENLGNFWQDIDLYTASNPNHPGIYSGTDSTVLTIDSITADMNNLLYRLYMQTPAFKCDQDIVTNAATLSVYKLDTDGDNIPDEDDLDDDNDGITDLEEGGETLDTDGDGLPNRIDLDSDDDDCKDVNEAGITTDDNNDGQVGIPIVNVDGFGRVTSTGDGVYTYGTPVDLDGNGTQDYLEAGDYATVISSPDDVEIGNNNEVILSLIHI